MWYTKYEILKGELPCAGARIVIMKTLWRSFFIAAVSLGGVAFARIIAEILKNENKKYIDI